MLGLVIAVIVLAGMWKIFEKAGVEGWKALIPFYNGYVLITRVAGKPWWYFLLLFVPIVNFVIVVIINIEVAKAFGKTPLFGFGLTFLAFIFYPVLGFGDTVYRGRTQKRVRDYDVIDETIYVDEEK